MTSIVYYNGKFIPEAQALLPVHDGGWLHGAGLFETMRAENSRIFRVESHIERLLQSAEKLLRPATRGELPSRVDFLDLLERNELKTARVRLTVSIGSVHPPSSPSDQLPPLTVCASAVPLSPPNQSLYDNGVQVCVSTYKVSPHDPLAGHKTTAYLGRLLGLRQAQQRKCFEALWFNTNNMLAEGCITNVFIIKDGQLKTPPLDTPVLGGIARNLALELGKQLDLNPVQAPLTINDLLDADELFLTNAIIQVLPVIRVEQHDIANGRVGKLTKKILDTFRQQTEKECTQA